jgi:hypothetical protein
MAKRGPPTEKELAEILGDEPGWVTKLEIVESPSKGPAGAPDFMGVGCLDSGLRLLARLELEPSGRHACEQSLSLLVGELSKRDASGNFHFLPPRLRGRPVSPVG